MPSRGTSESESAFCETLDELHEILETYRNSHIIILGWDFNASLHRINSKVPRDSLLKTFIAEQELALPMNYPILPTYMHTSTKACSQIDYWFSNCINNLQVKVMQDQILNVSDHHAITLHTPYKIGDCSPVDSVEENKSSKILKRKINWKTQTLKPIRKR